MSARTKRASRRPALDLVEPDALRVGMLLGRAKEAHRAINGVAHKAAAAAVARANGERDAGLGQCVQQDKRGAGGAHGLIGRAPRLRERRDSEPSASHSTCAPKSASASRAARASGVTSPASAVDRRAPG